MGGAKRWMGKIEDKMAERTDSGASDGESRDEEFSEGHCRGFLMSC